MSNKLKVIFLLKILIVSSVFAADYPINILKEVDDLANFPNSDFSAQYTIVQDIPGQTRKTTVAAVFRRDKSQTYTIIITKPENDKGQGYLKQGKTLWFYDPDSGKFNSTSSKDRFQNSNARNSDFTSSTLDKDYNIISGEKVKLGKYNCWKLDLEANNDEVTYPFMTIWISEDRLVRKTEDFSLSKKLLRTTVIPYYQRVGEKYFPSKMLYIEHLESEKTQITISKPSLKSLPDNTFSKAFLESVSR